jgi:O-succinylbenzoate synthase
VREHEARADGPGPVRVRAVELVLLRVPLVRPFRTARGTTEHKDALLVRVVTDDADGWGECGAEPEPSYTGETLAGARLALRDHLAPRCFTGADPSEVRGNAFAKAAMECALLDAELRASGRSLASYLGGTRTHVEAGVAIGIVDGNDELRRLAREYADAGYRRLKLKIEPGASVRPVAAVRDAIGDDVTLAVDANGSFTLEGVDELQRLDDLALQCIEQPLPPDALLDHAQLAHRVRTRVALDESIGSAASAQTALALDACRIVNVKWGRVGGIDEARRVHDVCVGRRVPAMIGGMLDTGVGRAVNLAVASLPGFTEPGDLSASDRYFAEDVTEPFLLEGGRLRVPDRAGIGVEPRADALRRYAIQRESLRR